MRNFHIDISGCSACGENHKRVEFQPVEDRDTLIQGLSVTHEAICPTTGQPLYMRDDVQYAPFAGPRPQLPRPTLGAMPRRLWLEQRQDHLLEAAQRFQGDSRYGHEALVNIFEELHCNAQELAT